MFFVFRSRSWSPECSIELPAARRESSTRTLCGQRRRATLPKPTLLPAPSFSLPFPFTFSLSHPLQVQIQVQVPVQVQAQIDVEASVPDAVSVAVTAERRWAQHFKSKWKDASCERNRVD